MENFYTLLGFGFVILCLAIIAIVIAIANYSLHIWLSKNKKIEVKPAEKGDSNKTTDE